MVMTIRNTCRMFDDLFQLVGNREMKSLNSSNISVGGLEPVSAESLEDRFSSIDRRFSQVIPNSAFVTQSSDVSCQDVTSNSSLSAPSLVAMRTEHPPDRGPYSPYTDVLGTNLAGPAAVSVSADATSLPRMLFADLLAMVQFFESRGRVPDSFLDTHVVVAPDFDIAVGGSSQTDSITAYRLRLSDPVNHVPGLSQGRDNIVPFLHHLMASSGASPLVASSASALHQRGSLDFTGLGLGSSLPPSSPSFSGLSVGSPSTLSVAPPSSSLPSVSAPPGFPSSSSFISPLPSVISSASFSVCFIFCPIVCFFASFACASWFSYGSSFSSSGSSFEFVPPRSFPGSFCCSFLVLCLFSFVVCSRHFTFDPFLCYCCAFSSPSCACFFLFSFCLGFFCEHDRLLAFPTIPSCSAPSHSLVPPVFLLGPSVPASSHLPSAPGHPYSSSAPLSSFVSSGVSGFPASSSGVSVVLGAHASGSVLPSTSHGSGLGFAGASSASDSPNDALLYHSFDD